jgi:multimeric flavodoxin WrbA
MVNGGYNKGNTWSLAELAKENLQKMDPDMEFDEIQLKDIDLPYCLGCSLCFRKGHGHCPHNAVIQGFMDKIEESDGIIFAAATYNMQIPALSKNLIDHMSFLLHRPRYFDKKALIISTTGAIGAKDATGYLAETFTGWGFNSCFQLPLASMSYNAYKPTTKDKQKCFSVTRRFYRALSAEMLKTPSFKALMPYNLFRGISRNYGPGSEYETYDGSYWDRTGLADKPYFPEIQLPVYKALYGNFCCWAGDKIGKHFVVTYR